MQIIQKPYNKIDFPPLTEEQLNELETLKNIKEEDIDLSDIPECKGNGDFYYIQPSKIQQTKVCIKVDNDNLAWLKAQGEGYQKELNNLISWARHNNVKLEELN